MLWPHRRIRADLKFEHDRAGYSRQRRHQSVRHAISPAADRCLAAFESRDRPG
jgi:hypothetical protein